MMDLTKPIAVKKTPQKKSQTTKRKPPTIQRG